MKTERDVDRRGWGGRIGRIGRHVGLRVLGRGHVR